jgi:hypothetical protein
MVCILAKKQPESSGGIFPMKMRFSVKQIVYPLSHDPPAIPETVLFLREHAVEDKFQAVGNHFVWIALRTQKVVQDQSVA